MVEQIILSSNSKDINGLSVESIGPKTGDSFSEQVDSCMDQLSCMLIHGNEESYRIAQQTFFISARNWKEYEQKSSLIRKKLSAIAGAVQPATSIVAQSPRPGSDVVLELICTKTEKGKTIDYKQAAGLNYTVVSYGTFKVVHASGMMGAPGDSIRESAEKAFLGATEILSKEGLSVHHIVRQWNYVEDIARVKDVENTAQNYQVFNNARARYYENGSFKNGYPAATGIGMTTGGVIIGFIAISQSEQVVISPIHNPKQIDAHKYSENKLAGRPTGIMNEKCTPKFERAKMVLQGDKVYMYISGTASIVGEDTQHVGDVGKQTTTTIENIFELFSPENQKTYGLSFDISQIEFSHLRIYVKHRKDIPAVQSICESMLRSKSSLYLESDICREELLVEIEGIFLITG